MIGRSLPAGCPVAEVLATIDRRFVIHTALWSAASLLAFGLVAAIIPNPVFGRQVPPQPFAIVVWFASAPLMGLLGATYSATAPSGSMAESASLLVGPAVVVASRDGTTLGTVASFGAFLAIGCPVCNKIALILLGASGRVDDLRAAPAGHRGRLARAPCRHARLAVSAAHPRRSLPQVIDLTPPREAGEAESRPRRWPRRAPRTSSTGARWPT